jgi:phosphoglucomutase
LLTGYTLGGVIHALLVIAISQAICLYRKHCQIEGPLFLGMDTHALSVPALASVLEV